MRYALDVALFVTVFFFTFVVFENLFYAGLAGAIIALAGDTLVWTDRNGKR